MTIDLRDDRGSTIPLILGFFLIAVITVGGSVALGQAFVQQRELQDTCDGAAAAAAATSVDLNRGDEITGRSLRLVDAQRNVAAFLARDPGRRTVTATAAVSPDGLRVRVECTQSRDLAFGGLIGRPTVTHHATSTARSAVVNG